MTARKRNEYLDLGLSDEDDDQNYDSEVAEEAKGGRTAKITDRRSKRRKLSANSSDEDTEASKSDSGIDTTEDANQPPPSQDAAVSPEESEIDRPTTTTTSPQKPSKSTKSKPKSNPSDPKNAVATKKSYKPGILYLSRIPPFMRPSTLSHLLSPFGPITRLFLTPEPPSAYLSRRKAGGNKKRSFIDGWVEFSKRKHAKICAEAINGQIVGGKKGGWYRDDVWNVKYLRGFGWGDLMAGVRQEEREREERVRVGLAREGRERKEFLERVRAGKVEGTRREKERKRKEKEGLGKGGVEDGKRDGKATEAEELAGVKVKRKSGFERRFRQNEMAGKKKGVEQSDEVKRVLSKIF